MSSKVYDFNGVSGIPCFSFNSDMKRLALSPNNELVQIYELKGSSWALQSTLTDHTSRVYGIDWSKKSNKIVTCGSDRNAYVWTEIAPGQWKPSLVLLRINRAAISVKWSPLENKFAIGTGNKLICVCYYEESNDWWVSKHIKKPIRSSVLSVDWHPNNSLLAAGSSDFTVRVYAAAIKDVDKKPTPTVWGEKYSFGNVMAEFHTKYGGWVHCVRFSPSGDQLCWVSHDSTISVADQTNSDNFVYVLKFDFLPMLTCLWMDDKTIYIGGYDNKPYKFEYSSKEIKYVKCIDDGNKGGEQKSVSAMSKFQNLDKKGHGGSSETNNNSTHTNSIKEFFFMDNKQFASSALDNKIVVWPVSV